MRNLKLKMAVIFVNVYEIFLNHTQGSRGINSLQECDNIINLNEIVAFLYSIMSNNVQTKFE